MALSTDDAFNLEVLKLLVTVAWVDGAVDQNEAQMLLGLGRSWTVPEPELQRLLADVKAGVKPTEPDWAMLKPRSDEVLQAARALVLTDGEIYAEESALLRRIATSLKQ
jgi:tellurite resistance protein